VSTNDPTRQPSRARIRTLRKNGLVSDGLQVPIRHNGRAAGSHTYHSTLFALALKAGQVGDEAGAKVLREHGLAIESRFADRIRDFLSHHTLEALAEAPFFTELTRATTRALDQWSRHGRMDIVFATGQVHGFTDESVIIEVKYHQVDSVAGDTFDIDLPRVLADGPSLHQGDYVWIFRQTIGSAALLDLLPAVATDKTARAGDAGAEGSDEAAEGLAYLESGAGGRPTAAEAHFLRPRRGGALPRRVVRPAG